MQQEIKNTTVIDAPVSIVWENLTNPKRMKLWMGEPEMNLEIISSWKAGQPIIIKGFHHVKFENKGKLLTKEVNRILKYNYISSISRLTDQPENYTVVEFQLIPMENRTNLILTLSNFPTESIFRHVDFYWKGTIKILKDSIEKRIH